MHRETAVRCGLWDRFDWIALLLITGAATLTGCMMLSHVATTGVWEDDGIYLATSKSLAEGKGYRHAELPGQPYQTKYPVLYPFVLSLLWRAFPEFPQTLIAMQAANAAFGAGAALGAYWVARRAWRVPVWLAIVGAASAIWTPFWVELTQYTMSEHLYALLSMAALACLFVPSSLRSERSAMLIASALGSGFFAAGALLCRSIGITAAVIVIATWLCRRRWREMIVAAVLPAAAWGGWTLVRHRGMQANSTLPQSTALRYDLDYSAWAPRDVGTAARVIGMNSGAVAWSLLNTAILPPPQWLDWAARGDAIQGDRPFVILTAVGIAGVVVLIATGLVATWRSGSRAMHWYLALYTAAVLIWPFQTDRLMLPLQPLFQVLLLTGIWRMGALAGGLLHDWVWRDADKSVEAAAGTEGDDGTRDSAVFPAERFSMGVGVLLAVNFLLFDYRVASSPKGARMREQQRAAAAMIRDRTEPDAVIAGIARGYFFLETGRSFVPILPFDDPVALYYARDRSFWAGGRGMSPGGIRAIERCIQERVGEYYDAAGVGYVLMADYGAPEIRLFGQYLSRHAETYERLADAGPYRLWRIKRAL